MQVIRKAWTTEGRFSHEGKRWKFDNIIIERDLPVHMDDGVVMRADVYRPNTNKKVPIVMAGGPYGKGVKY